jgi:hypothetical protein
MTKTERNRVSELLRATEFILLENIALKLVLEHRQVPNWRKLLDDLLADKEILAGVQLRFKDIHREMELGENPATALQNLIGSLPRGKVN